MMASCRLSPAACAAFSIIRACSSVTVIVMVMYRIRIKLGIQEKYKSYFMPRQAEKALNLGFFPLLASFLRVESRCDK